MINNTLSALTSIIIVAIVVVVFILVTSINIAIKKPKDLDNKDCESCPIKSCVIRTEKEDVNKDK